MAKQKTHSGTKDRFRVTKNGKVLSRQKNRRHILEKKAAARKRRLKGDTVLAPGDARRVKKLLNM